MARRPSRRAGSAAVKARVRNFFVKTNGVTPTPSPAPTPTPVPTPTPSGPAAITSPNAYSQPAGTMRYQRATANRSGTWSISGTDAANYTIDAATGIRTIKSAPAAAMAGITSNATKSVTLTLTMADGTTLTQAVTDTFTPTPAAGSMSEVFTADFSGADGTLASALPGFSLLTRSGGPSGPFPTPRLAGGRLVGEDGDPGSAGDFAFVHGFAAPRPNTEFVFTIWRDASASTARIGMVMLAADAGNCLGCVVQASGDPYGISLNYPPPFIRQGNSVTDGSWTAEAQGSTARAFRANGSFDVIGRVNAAGDTLNVYFANDAGEVLATSFALTGLTLGNKWGQGGRSAYFAGQSPLTGFSAMRGTVKADGIPLTITSVPTFAADNAPVFGLAWGGNKGAPTGIEVQWLDDDLAPVSPWLLTDSTITGNSIVCRTTAPRVGALRPRFRPRNDAGSVVQATEPVAVLTRGAFSIGYNLSAGAVFAPSPYLNNWGKFAQIVSGQVNFPVANINGQYRLLTNTGVTLNNVQDQGENTCVIVSSNPTTGVHELNVNANIGIAGAQVRLLNFSGAVTSFVVEKKGHEAEKYNPDWVAAWPDHATIWRDLDNSGANSVPFQGKLKRCLATDPQYSTLGDNFAGGVQPWEDTLGQIAALAAGKSNFAEYWHVWQADEVRADLVAKMTAFRDHPGIPSRIRLCVESGNEYHFSAGSFPGDRRIMCEGIRAGYGLPGATFAAPGPAIPFVAYDVYLQTVTTQAVPQGGYIALNITNPVDMFVAKQAAPAGTPLRVDHPDDAGLPPDKRRQILNSAYWEADTTGLNPELAGFRWQSTRVGIIDSVAREVFGNNYGARVRPIISGWMNQSDFLGYTKVLREFHPAVAALDYGMGYAWYASGAETFSAGVKAAYAANGTKVTVEQVKADIMAYMPVIEQRLRKLVYDAARLNRELYLYEGLFHCAFDLYMEKLGGPNNTIIEDPYGYRAVLNALRRSDWWRNYTRDYVAWLRANVPGKLATYTLLAGEPWAAKIHFTDASPTMVGIEQALAA